MADFSSWFPFPLGFLPSSQAVFTLGARDAKSHLTCHSSPYWMRTQQIEAEFANVEYDKVQVKFYKPTPTSIRSAGARVAAAF